MTIDRRKFIKTLGVGGAAAGALAIAGCARSGGASKRSGPAQVVVIGGGFGGSVAAKYIRKLDPSIEVTLIEANKNYVTCPSSNWVISGIWEIDQLTFGYETLASKYGIKVVHDRVTGIDPEKRTVALQGGSSVSYDRLIVSPGIDFKWETIDGYDAQVAEQVPHAWKAGPQTTLLRQQLEAMPDGGTFVIAAPPNPFRCPPGPYERISLVAHYFKNNKPRSKIILLDAKPKFSKMGLFTQGWRELYGYETSNSMIEYVPGPDGKVIGLKGTNTLVAGDLEDEYQGDVVNIIPAQKAGRVAEDAGLADASGWCPVHHLSWESTVHPHIHVIGDAAIQAPLPKSGYAANSEAKVCAAAVVNLLNDREPATPSLVNTCYSLVAPEYGISVAMVYDLNAEGKVAKVKGAGGLTPEDGNKPLEALYARNWFANITDDMFG